MTWFFLTRQQIVKITLLISLVPISLSTWLFLRWGFFGTVHHWFFIWLGPVICILFMGLIFGLLIALLDQRWPLFIATGIVLASYLVFFGADWYCWPAALIAGFIIWLGLVFSLREERELVKLRYYRILRPTISALMTGLVILAACGWYASPLVEKSIEEIEIPRPLFSLFFKPINILFFNPVTDKAIDVAGIFSEQEISQVFDNIDATLEEELYQLTNNKIRSIVKLYRDYIEVGLALALLAGLRALSIPFVILIVLLCWLLVEGLIKLGLVKIDQVAVQKEVLRL